MLPRRIAKLKCLKAVQKTLACLLFGFDGLQLPLGLLAYVAAAPELSAHQCVADGHGNHRDKVCQAQEHDVVSENATGTT